MTIPLIFDIETSALAPWGGDLLCIGWCYGEETGVSTTIPDILGERLQDPAIPKVSHSTFDPRWLKQAGVEVVGPYHDIMVMAHLLNENQAFGLEELVGLYLNQAMDKRLHQKDNRVLFTCDDGKTVPITDAPLEQLMSYCERDVTSERDLYIHLLGLLKDRQWYDHWMEERVPFTEVLIGVECAGMPIDLEAAAKLHTKLYDESLDIQDKLINRLGYNIKIGKKGTSNELAAALFSKVWFQEDKLPVDEPTPEGFDVTKEGRLWKYGTWTRRGLGLAATPKTGKTKQPTTKTSALLLQHGEHPFVQDLVQYRKLTQITSTYTGKYPELSHNGRLYGKYRQTGTVTGRLSSYEPNMQNQPSRGELGTAIRSLFRGRFIVGDHSQLEPRLMAHFSGDPILTDIYRNNGDIYTTIVARIFGRPVDKYDPDRDMGKLFVLALGYGAEADKTAEILSLGGYTTTPMLAAGYLSEIRQLFRVFFDWKDYVIGEAKRVGYVTTVGGNIRRLAYAFGDARWRVKTKGERQAVNAIIQGSAADVLRRNMLAVQAYNTWITLLCQVHDELVWEYGNLGKWEAQPEYLLKEIQTVCENPGYDLDVPLKFEPSFCSSWAEKGGALVLDLEEEEA